ncbi:hypothetical protein Rs2_35487 [Raphanus sativus]|nr:hypothetical protein Rs2_35487 [Raphanus sativus]
MLVYTDSLNKDLFNLVCGRQRRTARSKQVVKDFWCGLIDDLQVWILVFSILVLWSSYMEFVKGEECGGARPGLSSSADILDSASGFICCSGFVGCLELFVSC